MKSYFVLAGLATILSIHQPTLAQESIESQLEFVRKLRAKGYLDLAGEHLDKLRAIADPALQALIPLESARNAIATARMREPDQRPGLFLAARKDLQNFVDKNPNRPEAAQARLEIARLATFQGDTLLTKALREEDAKSRSDQARKAEAQFIQAGQELEAAVKQLTDLAANYQNSDPVLEKKIRQQLQQDSYQARFDRASNIVSRARTYLDDGKSDTFKNRGELMKEAIKSLESVLEAETPLAVKRQAEAWLMKCNQEIQEPGLARKYYNKVMDDGTKAAQGAQRLARLFYLQGIMMHLDPKSQYKDPELDKIKPTSKLIIQVENDAKSWLKAYPSFVHSPEGLAVQFQLANAIYAQAEMAMTKDPKDKTKMVMTPNATKLFGLALKYYAVVADSDSEHAEEAASNTLRLSVDRIKDLDLHQIKNFEDCFLKARYERYLLNKMDKDDPKGETKFKVRARGLIAALQRCQNLADAKTSPAKLDEVRFLLMSAYFNAGDLYRGAVAGEMLGRVKPASKRSPLAAAYGIDAYAAIYQRDKDQGNRDRLQALADYVLAPDNQKIWSTDPVTATARYQLAMLYFKDDNTKASLELLQQLPPDFPGIVFATGQAVFIALDGKEKSKDPAEVAYFENHLRNALARMPALPKDPDPSTAAMYFRAQLRTPYLLYAEANQELKKNEPVKALQKYKDMLAFIDQTAASLDKLPPKLLSPETRAQLDNSIEGLRKYARFGQSDIEYRAGRYDKVLEQTDAVVKAVAAKAGPANEPILMKDQEITSQMLGLALRAKVQKGEIAEAKKILNWMDRLQGEEGGLAGGNSTTLLLLIQELRGQIEDLKKYKDDVALKKTIANFSSFADELANKPQLETRDYIFLANFYNSLAEYGKAAKLYSKVPIPKSLEEFKDKDLPKDDKIRDTLEREIANYWYLQIEYAKALRLSKESKNKDDPNLKSANKILDNLIKHRHGRFIFNAQMEQNFIFMDMDLYGLSTKKWTEFMRNPNLVKGMPTDPKLKRFYFEAWYYNTYCWYKYSQSEAVIKAGKEKQFLKSAANYIVQLESAMPPREGWELVGERFQALLEAEPKLKEEYEIQKRNRKQKDDETKKSPGN